MRCASPAPPATLPPLDRESDDETLNDDDVGGLLSPLDDLPLLDDEDDLPTDPDFGIEAPSDPFVADGDAPFELDLGKHFGIEPDESEEDADDAAGFDKAAGGDLDDAEDELPPDAEERDGIDDGKLLLDGLELPELDADEHGTEGDERRFGLLITADESVLPIAEHSWRASYPLPHRERCGALAVADAQVVAASTDLLWLDRSRAAPLRIALEGTRITSLAIVGAERNVALCVTAFGRLFRRARLGSEPERLHDWRRAADAPAGSAESLELRQLGSDEPRAVLARVDSGRLLRSNDEGQTFHAIEPALRVSALSPTGSPLFALVGAGDKLAISFDGGQSWEEHALPSPAREVALGEAPFLCGFGSTLAIGDLERGLVVSNDGGQTFTRVRGAVTVTACAAGRFAGTSRVWAALYREASDVTELVLIDAASGEACVIARLEVTDDHDPEHSFEASRLERLIWDGEQLFAIGGPGLVVFQPPLN